MYSDYDYENISYKTYCDDHDIFCDEINKGQTWFILGLISIVSLVVTWIALCIGCYKKALFIKIIISFLIAASAFVSVLNVINYNAGVDGVKMCVDNACQATDCYPISIDSRPGTSFILTEVGACASGLAALFIFYSFLCGKRRSSHTPDTENKQHQDEISQEVISHHPVQSHPVKITPINLNQSLLTQNEEMFACAGTCGKTFKHNDRTRSEGDSGAIEVYCGPCKQQNASKCGEGVNIYKIMQK